MKKLFIVLAVLVLFSNPCFSAELITDGFVNSTRLYTPALEDTTGAMQAITVPSGVESCKYVLIMVHNGTTTDYTHIDNPIEFHYSSESSGQGFGYSSGLSIPMGKKEGDVLVYIRAATGQKISVSYLW